MTSAACVLAGLYEWTHFEDRFGIHVDARRYPVSACDFMAAHGVHGRGINDFYLGGYMLWHFWPDRERLPFMDIHPEDTPPALRLAYLQAFSSRRGWDRLDQEYRFDYALLSRSYVERPGLLDLLDTRAEWALVFVDDAAALYVRRDGASAGASDLAYTLLPGGSVKLAKVLAAAVSDSTLARTLRAELTRQAASSPWSRSFTKASQSLASVPSTPR